jgi:hypothetical protein
MKKSIILAATLAALSAPALAQAPVGGPDRTLGNGNVESQRLRSPQPRSAITNPSATGGVDGTLGNGDVQSQAVGTRSLTTGSTTVPATPSQGGVDRTLGNGSVESQRPGVGSPMTR